MASDSNQIVAPRQIIHAYQIPKDQIKCTQSDAGPLIRKITKTMVKIRAATPIYV